MLLLLSIPGYQIILFPNTEAKGSAKCRMTQLQLKALPYLKQTILTFHSWLQALMP